MLGSYLLAVLALAVMAAVWVGVQVAWKKAFPNAFCDPDALAGRMGCGGGCKSHSSSCSSNSKREDLRRDDEEEMS
jgi:hypothetical protein